MKRSAPGRIAALGAFALLFVSQAHGQGTVTLASWGGVYQQGEVKALFAPATESLGVRLREETLTGLADVRVQVKAGKVNWDIVDLSSAECAVGAKEGLFEKLDYSIIKTDGISAGARGEYWIGGMFYSDVIAWNTKKQKDGPKTWKEFWDVKKFPGTRSLYGTPRATFEIALLADGVPRDQLYPLDIDRAIKSLERIKPHVTVWWKSGAQSAQLLKDGEVDIIALWASRAIAVRNAGSPVDYTLDEGILNFACYAIPKGAPNKDAAMKVLARAVSPELQANIPQHLDYGPINELAFGTGKIPADRARELNSSPDNVKRQVVLNPTWWADNAAKAQEAFNNMIAR